MARKNRENEFAVIGLGRFGVNLARRLEEMGHPVLGIERDPQLAKEVEDKITEVFVLDATNPDALAEADITAFKTVVVAISDDFETNALITSTLKKIGIQNVISESNSTRHKEILLRVGADRGEGLSEGRLQSVGGGHGGDHRDDANDDAEGRQDTAHDVHAQGAEGVAHGFEQHHGAPSCPGPPIAWPKTKPPSAALKSTSRNSVCQPFGASASCHHLPP